MRRPEKAWSLRCRYNEAIDEEQPLTERGGYFQLTDKTMHLLHSYGSRHEHHWRDFLFIKAHSEVQA